MGWKGDMTPEEAARVIERFLDGPSDSIEWCDFAETRQEDPRVEGYRKRCEIGRASCRERVCLVV